MNLKKIKMVVVLFKTMIIFIFLFKTRMISVILFLIWSCIYKHNFNVFK